MSTTAALQNELMHDRTHCTRRRILCVMRWPVGGIRTFLLYVYPRLANQGFEFTFIGPDDSNFHDFSMELSHLENVEFVAAPMTKGKHRFTQTVRKELRRRTFHLIHSQGVTAGVHALLGNRGFGIPHVVTSHDVFRADQFAGIRGWVKRQALGRLLSRCDVLVNVSRDASENHVAYLSRLRRGKCKLSTIFNGIDVESYRNDRNSESFGLRSKLGINSDVFLMGFLGRFMEQKGFLPLLEALDEVATTEAGRRFHLAAFGRGDYLREYRSHVKQNPRLKDCVSFLDFVPNVASVVSELDLLVMPSLWEACPLLPMEAMVTGVPVLGTDCIGLREVLQDTPCRMVPAHDPGNLANGIREAMSAPWFDEASRFAGEATQRFDVERCANEYSKLFDEVIKAN